MRHISTSAVKDFPETNTGKMLKHVTSSMTHKEQRKFFNTNITRDYDDIFILRKMLMRQEIEKAIENGATQVVILGGGYDIRALFSSEKYKHVTFYELDRGPTRTAKLNAIKLFRKKCCL